MFGIRTNTRSSNIRVFGESSWRHFAQRSGAGKWTASWWPAKTLPPLFPVQWGADFLGGASGMGSTSREESASRRPGDVPQGLTLWLSLTGLLQDWGRGLCEGPESDEQEDSEGTVAFFWIFKSAFGVSASSLPHGVDRPARLHRCRRCRAGAHQHGAVDVGRNYQDAEEDGPDDGALQTQIVRAACHC